MIFFSIMLSWLGSNALSFYRSQNVLYRHKMFSAGPNLFVPAQNWIAFCAPPKNLCQQQQAQKVCASKNSHKKFVHGTISKLRPKRCVWLQEDRPRYISALTSDQTNISTYILDVSCSFNSPNANCRSHLLKKLYFINNLCRIMITDDGK